MRVMRFQDYENIFVPGAPVLNQDFLFGREQELKDVTRYIRRPGNHPIIIGHRGVGKTTLAIQAAFENKIDFVLVTCNPSMTFGGLSLAILRELDYDTSQFESTVESESSVQTSAKPLRIGVEGTLKRKKIIKSLDIAAKPIDPWTLFTLIKKIKEKVAIIIDEYDAIASRKKEVHSGIASTMKTLADHSYECKSRILVVGIAQSASDLLGRHESIERSAREIYLRPLRDEDIFAFLSEAEEQLKFTFSPDVKGHLVWDAMGYPYFIHLIGLECLDALVKRDKNARRVEYRDYVKAKFTAVNKAFRSQLRKYKKGVKETTHIEHMVISELVRHDDHRPLARVNLRNNLVKSHTLEVAEIDHALLTLQQDRKLVYISRTDDTVRFSEPLMAPFLRAWLFRSKPQVNDSPEGPQFELFDQS